MTENSQRGRSATSSPAMDLLMDVPWIAVGRRQRRLRLVVVLAAATLMLAACDVIPGDPMGMRLVGEDLQLAVCDPPAAPAVRIVMEDRVVDGDWAEINDLLIHQELQTSNVITLGADLGEGWQLPNLNAGTDLAVAIELADGSYLTSGFTLPGSNSLDQGDWLRSDDTLAGAACD